MMFAVEQTQLVRTSNKAEISILKILSSRLKEARALTGLTQYEAAQLIGVSKVELGAWEGSLSICTIPLSAIQRAAQAYDVSIDWLFGLVDDWELCPEVRKERDFAAHLQTLLITEQAKVAVKLIEQDNQIAALSEAVTALAPAIKNVYEAILRFWELNPQFNEFPGGAPVISYLDRADKAGHKATCQLVRAGLLPLAALKNYQNEPKNIEQSKGQQHG